MLNHSAWRVPQEFRLKKVFLGHSDIVYRVKWSPDGRMLATNSEDGTILLWDFYTGELITRFSGHYEVMNDLTWSPDGRFLVSTARFENAKIWDVKKKKLHCEIKGFQTNDLAYSPDGKMLASCNDTEVIIFDAATLNLIKVLPFNKKKNHLTITSVRWSSDGKSLAIGSEEREVSIYSPKDWSLIKVISNTLYESHDLLWLQNDDVLLIASGDQTDKQDYVIAVWDIIHSRLVAQLKGHTSPVLSLRLLHDKTLLASKANDTSVHFWQCSDWKKVATLEVPAPGYALDFHPSLPILALPYDKDFGVALWKVDFNND